MSSSTYQVDSHSTIQRANTSTQPTSEDVSQLQEQLREAQKLAGLGTVSAMLAHEYNNIFAPVVSYAQYALDKDDVQLMRKTLTLVLKQFDTVRTLSDRVLNFARHDGEPPGETCLKQVVQDAITCLGRDLGKDNISVVLEIAEDLKIEAYSNQLEQVFFNLVLNARQAMQEQGGLLKISATPIPDARVSIHVRDTGRGMSAEALERAFDPFFTTKNKDDRRESQGIGLGLAICKEIVEHHGGIISAESAEGRGTTFTITLPIEKAKRKAQNPKPKAQIRT